MLEGVKLARKIGRNPTLARFIELEMMPGDAVTDDDQLADAVASNLGSYGHPTATASIWSGTTIRRPSSTGMALSEGFRGYTSSTHRSCRSFLRWRQTRRRSCSPSGSRRWSTAGEAGPPPAEGPLAILVKYGPDVRPMSLVVVP
jgi:hypothetical protein